mmetsp:Transcript_3351/g.5829  ORF Transcript_3351/g.5829 Transcript_3351/m.5829 type:complete len:91 (+) Transcript_3351:66-338(+)
MHQPSRLASFRARTPRRNPCAKAYFSYHPLLLHPTLLHDFSFLLLRQSAFCFVLSQDDDAPDRIDRMKFEANRPAPISRIWYLRSATATS